MTKIEEMERLFKAVKDNGLRKMAWGTMALWVIFILCLLGKLEGMIFAGCFTALVTAVMAANSSEHKSKSQQEAKPDAAAPPAP